MVRESEVITMKVRGMENYNLIMIVCMFIILNKLISNFLLYVLKEYHEYPFAREA